MRKTNKRVGKLESQLGIKEQFIPHFSLLYASCCTSFTVEETTKKMNATCPTGISHGWALATKEELPEGFEGSNPWPCNDNPKWQHMYFVC